MTKPITTASTTRARARAKRNAGTKAAGPVPLLEAAGEMRDALKSAARDLARAARALASVTALGVEQPDAAERRAVKAALEQVREALRDVEGIAADRAAVAIARRELREEAEARRAAAAAGGAATS